MQYNQHQQLKKLALGFATCCLPTLSSCAWGQAGSSAKSTLHHILAKSNSMQIPVKVTDSYVVDGTRTVATEPGSVKTL